MPAGHGNPKTAYFDPAYAETQALLERARDYAVLGGATASGHPYAQVEALRVTARLTQVMAWLMAQRAVVDGEISPRQALQKFSLSAGLRQVCADAGRVDDPSLPVPVRDLLTASADLYTRICRLEQLASARLPAT